MFGRGKKKGADPSLPTPETAMTNHLKELCGGDEELYRALSHLMFLDPKKIKSSIENVLSEAQEFETNGNTLRAELNFRIAGGVSLYRADLEGVRKYFSKAASLAGDARPEYRTLAKRADEAITAAKKYYESSEPSPKV